MQLRYHPFDLRLRHVFTISRSSTAVQPTLVVELVDGEHHGYGESTTNDYYGFTLENMMSALEEVRPVLESQSLSDPASLWMQLNGVLGKNPFAQCALDLAAHDLWGKMRGKPVYELWGLTVDNVPLTDYTIGIDRIDVMVAKMKEFPNWPIYKIKLGTRDDLEIVRELRKHTNAVFRVDANCAWTAEETLRNAVELKELNVEFIEQPMPADCWDDMKHVYRNSALPVIADESCIVESDVPRCHGYFHGINIKLCKCGGLTPARRMIDEAHRLNLQVMVGCMTESTVGISAIAQLLPLLDYVDMDGALLLAEDVATGIT
ncbi:MAG: dipeptide epimerase, partial [Planctomycetes bacterium]|nr:dipeptide epimerase [Planctomycetota bacterium]